MVGCLLLVLAVPPARAAEVPQAGDAFDYTVHRWLSGGSGAYLGYADNLRSSGHYEILSSDGATVTFRARYSWSYRDSQGLADQGSEDRTVSFSLATRRYLGPGTDLDDWDGENATRLSVWFWIPPGVAVGDTVEILDGTYPYRVTSRDATVWSGGLPRKAISLRATGTGDRDDAYGLFGYAFTDTYYFDPATGFIIAERYEEHDDGSWNSQYAAFVMREVFDVTRTTYPVPLDVVLLAAIIAVPVGVGSLLALAIHAYRWRSRVIYAMSGGWGRLGRMYRVRSLDRLPRHENQASSFFGDFLEDFTRKALLAKERVAVAVEGNALRGFATYNREAGIGLVLANSVDVTENLRRFLGARDFFTEIRHRPSAGKVGYNVFETYHVLALDALPPVTYDPHLISRMTEADLLGVEAVARAVYKMPARRWLRAQLLSGDIGYVARVDGKVVGFAFASVAGAVGRLHTATVLPNHQNTGVGKELFRARLRALRELAVQKVITEIAHWNLASLHIAGLHGFRPVGRMYVETTRTVRVERTIVRR